jgi:DNA-binding MarR family transcriptional regulator
MKSFPREYAVIEHGLQTLMWTEQRRFAQLLSELALTLPQFLVLVAIKRRDAGCPIGELADEMRQSYPTMSDIVDRLEDKRLVLRERGTPEDRRKVVVKLTPQGSRWLERARGARRAKLIRALAHFSARDRREFLRLLTSYLERLEKESE